MINAIEMRYLRKIAGIAKFDRTRNEDIRGNIAQNTYNTYKNWE